MSESFEFGSCWTHSAGDNRAAILLLDTQVKAGREALALGHTVELLLGGATVIVRPRNLPVFTSRLMEGARAIDPTWRFGSRAAPVFRCELAPSFQRKRQDAVQLA
jgi:hypothetical protein